MEGSSQPPPPPSTPNTAQSSPARGQSRPTSPYSISLAKSYLAAARRDDNDSPLDNNAESVISSPMIPAPPPAKALRAFLMTCVAWSATVTTCLGPFFPLYMKENFNASTTLIGLCFSVLALMQFVTCPFVMPISRRINRLNSLRFGLLASVAGALLFGLVNRIPGFIIGRIISGVGDAFIDVTSLSFLIQYSPNIRKDIGVLEGASSIGYLLGPLLGGFLFFTVGFKALFIIMATPYIVLLFTLCFVPSLFPPLPSHPKKDRTRSSLASIEESTFPFKPSIDDSSSSAISTDSFSSSVLPSLSTRQYLLRLGRALCSSPSIPLYILVVMFVSGGIGWLDTSLAEHLVLSLGVTIEQAGLLFTVHILTYLFFSFFAAEIAFRIGEWRAILGGMVVWSGGLLLFGPAPVFHLFKGIGRKGGGGKTVVGLMAGTLGLLGISETFVFLPFVPLIHSRFQGMMGWSKGEAEDVVSSVWACTWGAGQMLGPLVGGLLMDTLPPTLQVGCVVGRTVEEGPGEEGVDYDLVEMECLSAFPWTSGLWGAVGLGLTFLLFLGVMRTRIKKAWHRCRKVKEEEQENGGMQEEEEEEEGEAGSEGEQGRGRSKGLLPFIPLSAVFAPLLARDQGEHEAEEVEMHSRLSLSLSYRRSSWSQDREGEREEEGQGGCRDGIMDLHDQVDRSIHSSPCT